MRCMCKHMTYIHLCTFTKCRWPTSTHSVVYVYTHVYNMSCMCIHRRPCMCMHIHDIMYTCGSSACCKCTYMCVCSVLAAAGLELFRTYSMHYVVYMYTLWVYVRFVNVPICMYVTCSLLLVSSWFVHMCIHYVVYVYTLWVYLRFVNAPICMYCTCSLLLVMSCFVHICIHYIVYMYTLWVYLRFVNVHICAYVLCSLPLVSSCFVSLDLDACVTRLMRLCDMPHVMSKMWIHIWYVYVCIYIYIYIDR